MFRSFYIVGVCLLFLSCNKEPILFQKKQTILTNNKWIMHSFIDYKTNISYETSRSIYTFYTNGTYMVSPISNYSSQYGTWYFTDNENYIVIGSNTFKLKTLTNKLLGLEYGNFEIYYVPYKK